MGIIFPPEVSIQSFNKILNGVDLSAPPILVFEGGGKEAASIDRPLGPELEAEGLRVRGFDGTRAEVSGRGVSFDFQVEGIKGLTVV